MKKKLNIKLFAKFYFGLTTEKEDKLVFDSEESEKMLLSKWEMSEFDSKREFGEFNQAKVRQEMSNKINALKAVKAKQNNSYVLIKRYAAAILIPLFIAGMVYYLSVDNKNHQLTWLEKQTKKGERMEVVLGDGSKVWLNSDTRFSYPEKFKGKKRQVRLDGEAYFEVTHNANQPFIVSTSKLDIKVLGTSFNVRSYINDKTISTTLVTGKVSVQRLNPKTNKIRRAILSPNQQAIFYKETEDFILDKVDVNKFTSWRQGKLVIEGKSFKELVDELERWFNVDINLQKSLYTKYSYTITITDETIEDVMNLIKQTTPSLTITYKGKNINISEK